MKDKKLDKSRAWYRKRIAEEEGHEIGAGHESLEAWAADQPVKLLCFICTWLRDANADKHPPETLEVREEIERLKSYYALYWRAFAPSPSGAHANALLKGKYVSDAVKLVEQYERGEILRQSPPDFS